MSSKAHKKFELKRHLSSLVALEDWLLKNLSVYSGKKKVPPSNILSILEYLKRKVAEQNVSNKADWNKTIDDLVKRQESILEKKNV